MNRRKLLTSLTITPLLPIFACEKNEIQAISAKPEMFMKRNYLGKDGYGAHYFEYNWNNKHIELKTNPIKDFGIIPGAEYPNLDSLYIKKTKIKRESKKEVYTILEVLEKE